MHNKLQFFFKLLVFNNLIFCNLYSAENHSNKNSFVTHVITASAIILNPRSVATDEQARALVKGGSDYIVTKACELPAKTYDLALSHPKITGVMTGALLAGATNAIGCSKRDAAIVGVASGSGTALLLKYEASARVIYEKVSDLNQQSKTIFVQAEQQCVDASTDLEKAEQDILAARAKLVKSEKAFKITKMLAQGVTTQKKTALELLDSAREHKLKLASSLDLTKKTEAKSKSVLASVRGNLATQSSVTMVTGGSTGGTGRGD